MSDEYKENITTVKCQECGTAFNIKKFHLKNACDSCMCKNLQFIVLKIDNPVNIELTHFLTIRYRVSEPIIEEIPSQGKRPEEIEKEKAAKKPKLGFT